MVRAAALFSTSPGGAVHEFEETALAGLLVLQYDSCVVETPSPISREQLSTHSLVAATVDVRFRKNGTFR